MTDIVKVKQGVDQVYPQTHWEAVEGKPTLLKGDPGDQGVPGPQGPKGDPGQNATTTLVATSTSKGLMAAADKVKLDALPAITFEKVGEV
ncbi:hypothetical protein [Enterococcus sp. DIV1420a]|uniref:hypothetical protein n=1 Tax=Enterococcus sp. DIV1420a TaxID=2774672 RepID=UPI003F244D35